MNRTAKKNILLSPYKPGDEHKLNWYDPALTRFVMRTVRFWEKYFRYEVVGKDRIPKEGPVVFALNHGLFAIDFLLFPKQIYKATGRRARTVAEHLMWKIPVFRDLALNVGIVDGTPRNAIRILKNGDPLIVYPGGAKEAMRSSGHKYELQWADRYGFIKVAIATGAPIIPCICIGVDDAYVVLMNGYHRWKRTFVPLTLFFGLGLFPLPVKLTHYVGRPIHHAYRPEQADDLRAVKALHRRVLREAERVKAEGLKKRKLFGLF